MVMLNTLSRMGLRSVGESNVTVHGFRTSFRTWSEESGHDQTVAEFVMSHEVGSRVERAYQRSDLFERRRGLMGQWADFILPFNL
jgi:integrase